MVCSCVAYGAVLVSTGSTVCGLVFQPCWAAVGSFLVSVLCVGLGQLFELGLVRAAFVCQGLGQVTVGFLDQMPVAVAATPAEHVYS